MVKIEVRQNGLFKLGYPYNSNADKYFESLSDAFIKNYGLDPDTVVSIHDHKNATQKFDLALHEYVLNLSKFIFDFDNYSQPLINDFEKLSEEVNALLIEKNKLEKTKAEDDDNYAFISSNLEKVENDIKKVNELIKYYQTQIIDERYFYNDSYIVDSELALEQIIPAIQKVEENIIYYKNLLFDNTKKLSEIKKELNEYSFESVTIRMVFEEWNKRTEPYFLNLVNRFKNQYDTYWTYGSSMIYGEKCQKENEASNIYDTINEKWIESITKKYNMELDVELKEYSLDWLKTHKKVDPDEFSFMMEHQKASILKKQIESLSLEVDSKKAILKLIVTSGEEQSYFRYREIFLEKMKYLYNHEESETSEEKLVEFDNKLKSMEVSYNDICNKKAKEDYLQHYAEWFVSSMVLQELSSQLDASERAISTEFKIMAVDNSAVLARIAFYNNEKTELQSQHDGLMELKEKHQMENNSKKYDMTIIQSYLNEKNKIIKELRKEYERLFSKRLHFYVSNATTEFDGIIGLLNGKIESAFTDSYEDFLNYSSNIEWYDAETRNNLKLYYGKVMQYIFENLLLVWNKEFTHCILDNKRKDIYFNFFVKELKLFYAYINDLILKKTYNLSFSEKIMKQKKYVFSIFEVYVDIAFNLMLDITIIEDIFDYNKTHTFTISKGNENKEDILKTFDALLVDKIIFANNKNTEFGNHERLLEKKYKIDKVWLDMEKSYV